MRGFRADLMADPDKAKAELLRRFSALVIMTILVVCEREDEEALNRSAAAIIEG